MEKVKNEKKNHKKKLQVIKEKFQLEVSAEWSGEGEKKINYCFVSNGKRRGYAVCTKKRKNKEGEIERERGGGRKGGRKREKNQHKEKVT